MDDEHESFESAMQIGKELDVLIKWNNLRNGSETEESETEEKDIIQIISQINIDKFIEGEKITC